MADLSPPLDVYYEAAADGTARAVVEVELAGIDPDAVELDIEGRYLELSGVRAEPPRNGRVYQQASIARGAFRSVIELRADVVAESAAATYADGVLRVELPLIVFPQDS